MARAGVGFDVAGILDMTEADAKTKWCPIAGLAGAVFFANPARTMTPADDAGRNCIGSACAMWRGGKHWLIEPGLHIADDKRTLVDDDTGYCGLAGKP